MLTTKMEQQGNKKWSRKAFTAYKNEGDLIMDLNVIINGQRFKQTKHYGVVHIALLKRKGALFLVFPEKKA